MFIWDFIADTVLGQIIDWIYGQIVGFLGDFFMQMGNMGADLFEMGWVQSICMHTTLRPCHLSRYAGRLHRGNLDCLPSCSPTGRKNAAPCCQPAPRGG